MNDRKQHVIKIAHQLFIEKGFQSTSIQDILDYSGISKGTFYNYFSSKNELLMAVFDTLQNQFKIEQNKLLINQDRADIEIFIKQIELSMKLNKRNKLFSLFEEIFVSNDQDLKEYLKKAQLNQLSWTFHRLVDIYGEEKKPYLLDCSIMFTGMLHHHFHYFFREKQSRMTIHQVIRYCIARLTNIVKEVSSSGEQLFKPDLINIWFPNDAGDDQGLRNDLLQSFLELKKIIYKKLQDETQHQKWTELLDFIQEELLQSKQPRTFLIESALDSLENSQNKLFMDDLSKIKQLIDMYLKK